MDKFAQRRSLLNKMREGVNAPSRKIKSLFDKEYSALVDAVKKTDNQIRAIAVGETIDGANPGKDAIALKQLLKDARSKFNRREYLVVASLLGRYHRKMDDVMRIIRDFKLDFDKVHNKFLFAPLEDRKEKERNKHIEHLRDLRQRLGEEQYPAYFIKEAGIWDQLHNLFTNRGRALSNWEKNYPKAVELREGAEKCLQEAENLQANLLSTLKEMATARATNDINGYVELANTLPAAYRQFDADFRNYYSRYVKPALDSHEMFNAPQSIPTTEIPKDQVKEIAKQEVKPESAPGSSGYSAPVSSPFAPAPGSRPSSSPSLPYRPTMLSPGQTVAPSAPATVPSGPPSNMSNPYQAMNDPKALLPSKVPSDLLVPPGFSVPPSDQVDTVQSADDGLGVAAQHKQFYAVLDKLGNEDPLVVAAYIRKYAKTIEGKDPVTAIKLFGIAKRLKG